MQFRWGRLTKASNDKGPFKLGVFEIDGKPVVATIIEPYGLQASPPQGSLAAIFYPGGDEGRAIAFVEVEPAKRTDAQEEGELSLVNVLTGNSLKHDKDGNTEIATQADLKLTPQNGRSVIVGAGAKLQLGNAAVTGLPAGQLANQTNASLVLVDESGASYVLPCKAL